MNEVYDKARAEITNGKRLPYNEYVYKRTIYWAKNLATLDELEELSKIMLETQAEKMLHRTS